MGFTLDQVLAAKNAISRKILGGRRVARARSSASGTPAGVTALSVSGVTFAAANNVHAIGVGLRTQLSRPDDLCIRFYVERKVPLHLLRANEVLPKVLEGIPTDVIELPRASLRANLCSTQRRQAQRPALAGISLGSEHITAGTAGCFCRSAKRGEQQLLFMLSCSHVLANLGAATKGDAIYQPGIGDGGKVKENKVGQFWRAAKLDLRPKKPNRVDAAIARFDAAADTELRVCTVGKVNGSVAPKEGMSVLKHGRTTALTYGRLADISLDILVNIDDADPNSAVLFVDQLKIDALDGKAFGLTGDSGALVASKGDRQAVGLYFAGPADGSYGLANPIAAVLESLQVTLA